MTHSVLDMDPRDLLIAIHNNLNQRFFADKKAAAKRLFKSLVHGTEAPFIAVSTEQFGQIKSVLRLDLSAFSGKLNFRIFRASLASHLYRIDQRLESGGDCNVYVDQNDPSGFVYNLPGVTEFDGHINALVTGVRVDEPGSFVVTLMYAPVDVSGDASASQSAERN